MYLISLFQQHVDTALTIPGFAGAHFLVFVHDQNQCIRFIAAVLKTLYVCVCIFGPWIEDSAAKLLLSGAELQDSVCSIALEGAVH